MDSVKFNETNGADENEKKASSAEFPIEEEEEEGEMALKSASNHNDNSGRSAGSSLRRLFRRDSVRAISKRNMRHPRDMDVCHGSNTHPGTQAWMLCGNLEALKSVGLRPSKKIKLFNGKLESRLVRYEMYSGSKKAKKQQA